MTTFYLIRHAANDFLGRALAGRQPEVHLNAEGRQQAERLVQRLDGKPIHQIVSSPLERCRETAEPLARARGLPIQISQALHEVDFGEWTNATMTALESDERWREWNSFRSGHKIPQGEIMVAIQSRIVGEMIRWRDTTPNAHFALVSHGDPIRAALCYWLGMPLDHLYRLQIDPASISIVHLGRETAIIAGMNLL